MKTLTDIKHILKIPEAVKKYMSELGKIGGPRTWANMTKAEQDAKIRKMVEARKKPKSQENQGN